MQSRFEIRRTLGEGGMGVVYEARDSHRDMTVALKTLRTLDANLLYHFKNEFRALADLHHPNLCNLYELFQDGGHWFFTMEMVDGTDFLAWIKPRDESAIAKDETIAPGHPQGTLIEFGGGRGGGGTLLEFVGSQPVKPATSAAVSSTYDEMRLRDALAQLAAGLEALHEAGKVHRDIKPSNILVTREGRVVIMDFGLVADDAILAELRASRMIAGTPTFMAPEQGVPGATIGPAADWYAVGVMLYQILTSKLPHAGATVQELTDAKRTPPPAPSQVAYGVPLDLAELCHRMLSPDPASRPSGREVLERLGSRASLPAITVTDVFVGRRAELGTLHTALADSRRGAVSVFVEGASGLGKTVLVKRFLDEIQDTGTLILRGRCYAEETVPYKAFDGIVDALSRHLIQMTPQRVAELVPPSTALAARLFPVLRRVPLFAHAVTYDPLISAQELRARAFAAVIELLGRMAAQQPLVLFVDDLQWADPDSLLLLRELMRPESAPPLAFVASIRTGSADAIANTARIEPRWIRLQPLPPDDASMLMDRLLPRDATADRRQEIAREAAGHPLFLAELAHHLAMHPGEEMTTRLDEALWQRAMALEVEARHLLQIIAVAGTPIDLKTVAHAAELSPTHSAPLVAALRGARFVKTSATAAGDLIEPYHDRVREAITSRLERSALVALSSHLAHAMLDAGMGDTAPELVVRHLFAAGDTARGRDLAERAAQRALASLAFDRAAEFFRAALSAGPRDAMHARSLHLALANALASGGRGAEAADEFLAASTIGPKNDRDARLDCRRMAADQLLASGHLARGLAELSSVLYELGEHIPATPHDALASMEAERARNEPLPPFNVVTRLSVVGVDHPPDPPDGLLRRLDVYQSASLGLLLVDNVRGAYFQARAVSLAARSRDPRRFVRALVFEAVYRAQEGETGRAKASELLGTAAAFAGDDGWMAAYLVLGNAWLAYYHGRFRRAVELFKDADARFRGMPGVVWEQNQIMIHRLRATDYQGAWGELRALYDEYLRDAQRRDDRYVEASITRWFNVLWLAHDRPDLAGADLDRSVWTPPEPGRYHLQHFLELRARVELALYRGDGAAQGSWARPGLAAADESLLLRIQIARAIADWLLGRIAACEGNVAEIELRARALADQRINYAQIWSGLLMGAAIAQRGDRGAAVAKLEATAALADANDFPLCAMIARLRAGQLLGASPGLAGARSAAQRREGTIEGAQRVHAALGWLTGQDIRNPLRMCDVFAPGF